MEEGTKLISTKGLRKIEDYALLIEQEELTDRQKRIEKKMKNK